MRHGNASEEYDVGHFEECKRLSGNSWQHETAGRDEWNLLKRKAGNTSSSACLPFGNVAYSPYSGGYSSGYGNFTRNGGEEPGHFFEGDKLIGFSHFTHSGSGFDETKERAYLDHSVQLER